MHIEGIGYGFIYLPAIVMVANYFEEKRAFATGIAVCGSGIGGFIMAPFTQLVLNHLGWRGCLLVLSGVNLICLFSAFMFRSIETHNRLRMQRERQQELLQPMAKEPLLVLADDSEDETNERATNRCIEHSTFSPNLSFDATNGCGHDPNRMKTSSFLTTISESKGRHHSHSHHTLHAPPPTKGRRSSSHLSASTISFAAARVIAKSAEKFPSTRFSDPNRSIELELSTEKEEKPKIVMFDLSLLTSPSFVLFAFAGFLTLSGFFIPFMYLVDRSIQLGASRGAAALLLSVIGITNTLGRVFCGWVSDRTSINALAINNVALIGGGIFTLLSPIICNTYTMLVVYSFAFGFSIGNAIKHHFTSLTRLMKQFN
jgi:hypothetical protein